MKQRYVAALLAEAVGTFVLVMVVLNVSRYGLPFFTALGAALSIAGCLGAIGRLSGGHYNPAITLGLFVIRKVSFVRTVAYILAQAVGAAGGWRLYEYLIQNQLNNTSAEFDWRIFVAEAVGMAIFGVVIAAVVSKTGEEQGMPSNAMVVGVAYFLGATVAGLASAGIINPALAGGVRSFDMNYFLAPIVGSVVGMGLYAYIMEPVRGRNSLSAAVFGWKKSYVEQRKVAAKPKKATSKKKR